MSDEISRFQRERGVKIEIEQIPSGNGVFDVALDGNLLYTKYETGRFPTPGEITRKIIPLL